MNIVAGGINLEHAAAQSQPRSLSNRRAIAFSLVPVLIALCVTLPFVGDWCRLMPDSFKYLSAARALSETGAFPPEQLVAPPGFPLMLVPLMAIGPVPFVAIRILLCTCFAVSILLTHVLLTRTLGPRVGLAATILTATSALMMTQTATLLSEIPYLPFSIACLLLSSRWRTKGCGSLLEAAFAGLLASFATLIRAMGIVLAPIMLICLLLPGRRTWKSRLTLAAVWMVFFAAPQAAWQVRQSRYPSNYGYGAQWTRARDVENTSASGAALQLHRIMTYGPMRLADIGSAMVPPRIGWRLLQGGAASPAAWMIGLPVVIIALFRLIRLRTAIDLYVVMTLAMLALWPWDEGARLVVPLLPIFWGYFVWAVVSLGNSSRNKPAWYAAVALPALLFASAHFLEIWYTRSAMISMRSRETSHWSRAETLADWQTRFLPDNSTLLGVISKGHNDKLIIAGASYLSGRPLLPFFELGKSNHKVVSDERTDFFIWPHDLKMADLGFQLGNRHGESAGFVIYAAATHQRISHPQ